jgi:hypothetical protein
MIMEDESEKIRELNQTINSPTEPILMARELEASLKTENNELNIELQKIPIEILEKYVAKIHIINVSPYKRGENNIIEVVIEAELLQYGIKAKRFYFDDANSIIKLQFTDKEDYVGINEIVAVEKNAEGKTMVYFTLGTAEIDAIVVPQIAFVSSLDD